MFDKIKEYKEKYGTFVIGKPGCPFCSGAVGFLVGKGKNFQYVDRTGQEELIQEIERKYEHITYPMVFFEKDFVGGYDKLIAKCP